MILFFTCHLTDVLIRAQLLKRVSNLFRFSFLCDILPVQEKRFLLALEVQMLDSTNHLGPAVLKVESIIYRMNHYLLDSTIGFPNTYPLDSDLSSG